MVRQVYADNVDANGKAFETVGENIRKGARAGVTIGYITPESFGAVGDGVTDDEELNGDFILNITYDTISTV